MRKVALYNARKNPFCPNPLLNNLQLPKRTKAHTIQFFKICGLKRQSWCLSEIQVLICARLVEPPSYGAPSTIGQHAQVHRTQLEVSHRWEFFQYKMGPGCHSDIALFPLLKMKHWISISGTNTFFIGPVTVTHWTAHIVYHFHWKGIQKTGNGGKAVSIRF